MTTVGGAVSQANLKIVESTLAGMAEKEKEKEKGKHKEKSTDKEIEVEKEKGMKSGGSLEGESYLRLMREGEPRAVLCCVLLLSSVSFLLYFQHLSPSSTITPSQTHS